MTVLLLSVTVGSPPVTTGTVVGSVSRQGWPFSVIWLRYATL
jgi:hypothetical protein